jgi:protein TonB
MAPSDRKDESDRRLTPTAVGGRSFVMACVLGSFAVHGVAYGVLRVIRPPTIKDRTSEDIIRRVEPPKPAEHQVKLVEPMAPVETPKPQEAPKPSQAPRLKAPPPDAMTPPPAAMAAAPSLDLTRGAGVNQDLTSADGEEGYGTADSALGDPDQPVDPRPRPAPPMDPPPPEPMAPPPPPPRRPAPVYVKDMPVPVTVPQVPYPAEARRQGIEGTVRLSVTIGSDGRVLEAKVVQGLGFGLDEAARRALLSARFKPAVGSDGKPMTHTIPYRYTFQIDR